MHSFQTQNKQIEFDFFRFLILFLFIFRCDLQFHTQYDKINTSFLLKKGATYHAKYNFSLHAWLW